jgi:hypothetical protein
MNMLSRLAVEHGDGVITDEKTLCDTFNLSWLEAGFLKALLAYSVAGPEEFPPIDYSPRQHIYLLRKKMGPYQVTINTYGKGHYGISKLDKDRIAKLLGLIQ